MIQKYAMNLLVALLSGLIFSLGVAQAGEALEGSAKADKLDACVAPTAQMRRSHFELIKHQRDITVHQGIRKTDNSIAGCVDCHVRKDQAGQFVPVTAEKQFCDACHDYAGVTLDCFSCHAATPTTGK